MHCIISCPAVYSFERFSERCRSLVLSCRIEGTAAGLASELKIISYSALKIPHSSAMGKFNCLKLHGAEYVTWDLNNIHAVRELSELVISTERRNLSSKIPRFARNDRKRGFPDSLKS